MIVSMLVAVLLSQTPAPPTRVVPDGGPERPLYRKVQPGEQRDEGLLRRITCPSRGPIALVVKQKETVVQYTAPRLASVDVIAYRKDFKGPITCEGFGAGLPVYITWKPDGKTRRAVAVEILPDY